MTNETISKRSYSDQLFKPSRSPYLVGLGATRNCFRILDCVAVLADMDCYKGAVMMSTRRAQNHKDLVAFEKKFHHRAGIHWRQRRKTRYKSLTHAVYAESAYEWHKREKQNPELARELNDLFDFF